MYTVAPESSTPEQTDVTRIRFTFPHFHARRPAEISVDFDEYYPWFGGIQLEFDTKPLLFNWSRIEDTVLQTDALGDIIHIRLWSMHPAHFERLLIQVKEGKVLAQLRNSGRRDVTLTYRGQQDSPWEEWQVALEDIVTSVPGQIVDVDGQTLELDSLRQFELWRRRNDKADKENYLRGLLAGSPPSPPTSSHFS
jgi:hypothetical protein